MRKNARFLPNPLRLAKLIFSIMCMYQLAVNRLRLCFMTIALAGVLYTAVAESASWTVSPSVSASETYMDNVTLTSTPPKETEWITQINPGISLQGTGKELNLALNYRLQNLLYLNEPKRNNSYQQLRASANATIQPQLLFLDANTSLSQQVLSASDKVGVGNVGVVQNRSDVRSTRVSPYLRTRIANSFLTELRYTYDNISYSGSSVLDNSSNSSSIFLTPSKRGARFTWRLNWEHRETSYKGRADERRENAALNLSYQVDPKVGVVGIFGYENNKYSSTRPDLSGNYWNLSATWQPSRRTAFSVNAGERFFGDTKGFSFSRQGRRSSVRVSYSEDISTRRQLQLKVLEVPVFDANGNPVIDINTGSQLLDDVELLVSFDQVFLLRKASASFGYRTKKTTADVTLFAEKRAFEDISFEDKIKGSTVRMTWTMSRKSSITASATRRTTERLSSDDVYQVYFASIRRRLFTNANTSLDIRHLQRDGDSTNNSYKVNTITANFRVSW